MKKDITFIYMDSAEKALYTPIAKEAEERGYKVTMTQNKFAKCEIGFYCQHVNFPQFSKFSIIMLHDIIQQCSNWPDLWFREPWSKYDIGILPSNVWEENWNKCSQFVYTRPRLGVYKIGWPKADVVAGLDKKSYKEKFYSEHKLDPQKKTVLYAPSWENDGKQDDFVQSMLKLDVNILIKQAAVDPNKFPDMAKAIDEMYLLHKDNPRVKILDPKQNIFNAILAADILVSEESSTMCEAMMMGIPSVSVSDWLIPDVVPSRYPRCDYEFVNMTLKSELTSCVQNIINNYSEYEKAACEYRDKTFPNIGNTSKMIMDIVDDCVDKKAIRYAALEPKSLQKMEFKRWAKHTINKIHKEVYENYRVRSKFVAFLWNILKTIRHSLIKKG